MTDNRTLSERLVTAAAMLRWDKSATEQEIANAALMEQAAKALLNPALRDTEVLTAIADVLTSQARSSMGAQTKYWTRDEQMHDAAIESLNQIYQLIP